MPFETTKLINNAFKNDECQVLLPYGPLGVGKSSFACKVVAEVYGTKQQDGTITPNWEAVKEHLVFHPKDFVERCEQLIEEGKKDKVIIWDDAGLWLFALEHHNPFVKAVTKYLNVARTNWAALIFTTPLPLWVLKKVRGFPQALSIKIVKASSDEANPHRPRIARAFRMWITPDMKKSGVHEIYQDKFNAIMPNDFFYWYKPIRDGYAKRAVMGMREELKTLVESEKL